MDELEVPKSRPQKEVFWLTEFMQIAWVRKKGVGEAKGRVLFVKTGKDPTGH